MYEWDLLKISESMGIMIIMSEKSMSSCSKVMREWIEFDGKGSMVSPDWHVLNRWSFCDKMSTAQFCTGF